MIFIDIMLGKWPFKAQEYLKYMQCIRLAASKGYNNGWIAYDEQYRLKKTRLPFSSWALIDQELWVLYVATNSVSHPTAELGITNSRSSTSYNTNFDNNLNPEQNNYRIRHPNILSKERSLYRYDGVHLSNVGNDVYLNNIKGALEAFDLSDTRIFPPE